MKQEEQCKNIYKEICEDEEMNQCQTHYKRQCHSEPYQDCQTTYTKTCRSVQKGETCHEVSPVKKCKTVM